MAKKTQLGKLPPTHTFFLNPYSDNRFTRCPQCGKLTKIRKFPFVIHIDPQMLLTFNLSGPYCPPCDLIILHQDKVEQLLTAAMMQHNPTLIGNDYLIIGTVERAAWRKASTQGGTYQEMFDNLHDFKKVVRFEPQRSARLPDKKDAQ